MENTYHLLWSPRVPSRFLYPSRLLLLPHQRRHGCLFVFVGSDLVLDPIWYLHKVHDWAQERIRRTLFASPFGMMTCLIFPLTQLHNIFALFPFKLLAASAGTYVGSQSSDLIGLKDHFGYIVLAERLEGLVDNLMT
jgi:hypothetical protein